MDKMGMWGESKYASGPAHSCLKPEDNHAHLKAAVGPGI